MLEEYGYDVRIDRRTLHIQIGAGLKRQAEEAADRLELRNCCWDRCHPCPSNVASKGALIRFQGSKTLREPKSKSSMGFAVLSA